MGEKAFNPRFLEAGCNNPAVLGDCVDPVSPDWVLPLSDADGGREESRRETEPIGMPVSYRPHPHETEQQSEGDVTPGADVDSGAQRGPDARASGNGHGRDDRGDTDDPDDIDDPDCPLPGFEPVSTDLPGHRVGHQGEVEVRQARVAPNPRAPTAEELRIHRASGHLPFRSWCPDCVCGRAKNHPHFRKRENVPLGLPYIHFDYFFVKMRMRQRTKR